nr:hypothetical protein [Tanacetum cinerariifolium]
MRKKTIPLVKVLWKNHPEREATWENEEVMRTDYPHFFSQFGSIWMHPRKLQKQVLSDIFKGQHITISSVPTDGKNMIKVMIYSRKVLVVLDDIDHIDQLEALAGHSNWYAFGKEIQIQSYKELSKKVVCYAAGLPLTIKVLGSFLCGKDELEWKDAIERLKTIPLKETLEKLELSYNSLEDDYKEIFLDVACVLKWWNKDEAIMALECCGFHARNGLRVLEQKSLITISEYGVGDAWVWLLDSSGEYLVSSACSYIDDLLLPTVGYPTRWVKVVPIKINIFAWKVCLDKLPTRLNLSLRGIDKPSIIFLFCSLAGESCSHLLFSCSMARILRRKVARWWDFDIPEFSSYEDWIAWFNSIWISKVVKDVLEGVFYVMW